MSSSFRYTLTKLRSLPSSLNRCLRRSAYCVVSAVSTSPTVAPLSSTVSFLSAYCRRGVGIRILAISVLLCPLVVWSGSGRKLLAWSNLPFLIDSTTNEYHGHEFSRSVFEKYASQSGCEWKMPIRSSPRCARLGIGAQQIFLPQFVTGALLARECVLERHRDTSPSSPSRRWRRSSRRNIRSGMFFGVRHHHVPRVRFNANHPRNVRSSICPRRRTQS